MPGTNKEIVPSVNVTVNVYLPAQNNDTSNHPVPNKNKDKSTDLGVLAAGAAEMYESAHPKGAKVPDEQKHMKEIAAVAVAAYVEHKKQHPNDHDKKHIKDLGAIAAAIVDSDSEED